MSKRELVQISLRVEADLLRYFEKEADFFNISRSALIRIALIRFVHDIELDSVLFEIVEGVE